MKRTDIQQAMQQNRQVKAKQNLYKDAKATVMPHNINEGDTSLLPAQQFSRKVEAEGDPDIGLPATYEGHRGDQGQAGDHHQPQ